MGLRDKLSRKESKLTSFNGATPRTMPGSSDLSLLHYEYSINNNPNLIGKPQPSKLDLNGVTPPKYWDNRPT